MRCASFRAQFRGCPRNCKRRAFSHRATGAEALGRRAKATTREPGDRPKTSAINRRRWDGWGTDEKNQTAVRLRARHSPGDVDANNLACAQDAPSIGEITVTADRIDEPVNSTGSDVTVIPGSRLAQWGSQGITEVLRDVAGVEVTQYGGPGALTEVRLRGADPGQALVLIDGVPIGNVAATDGSIDFGNLTALDIDRIEVLRGPQSALYGSDAMSGVINIITKKGKPGKPRISTTIEAGSYGTISSRASVSGATDNWTYSLGVSATYSQSFPAYGYRVNRPLVIGDGVTPLPPLPDSAPVDKGGLNGRFTYTISPTASVDFGFSGFGNAIVFSNPYAVVPSDVFSNQNNSQVYLGDAFARLNFQAFGGALNNHIGFFTSATDNSVNQTEGCYNAEYISFYCNNTYHGSRWGLEYQGDLVGRALRLADFRRAHHDRIRQHFANAQSVRRFVYADQRAADDEFGLCRIPAPIVFSPRFHLRRPRRSIEDGSTFVTGRATVAYHIDETGTKLRAAFGNGAKAATLYQRYSQYGDPGLLPEQNVGGEIGIDQKVFGDLGTVSATFFEAQYSNLIASARAVLHGCATRARRMLL